MIVSHEWLKQFAPQSKSAVEIGELLGRHCVTLDSIARIAADLSRFVVGQVVSAARHPDSDHLWITKVDDGSGEILDVVCGAPNVEQGAKYPFARTGTVMPAGLTIEKRKIRGQTSNGMLCSANELGLGEDHDGILKLDTDVAPGTSINAIFGDGDAALDLDVLPNRPDLLCHRGVAREVAAILGTSWSAAPLDDVPGEELARVNDIPTVRGTSDASSGAVSVRIENVADCPSYIAAVIRGVSVTASPKWLRERLASVGVRSINNVVDATNYVLQAFGQPVHAFDLARLTNSSIVVRSTRDGEQIVTLDGVTRNLPAGTTVICDESVPVAIAGVMGGRDSEVTDSTTDILLEVAQFDARFVRRVRKIVALNTDASYRFERGVDAGGALEIARIAAALISHVANGKVESLLEVGLAAAPQPEALLRASRLERVLGIAVAPAEIKRRLEALACTVRQSTTGDGANEVVFAVSPPSWRHDLKLEIDLIEEVARLGGFDQLPDELRPFRPGNVPDDPLYLTSRRVRNALVASGLSEVRPMPFTDKGNDQTPRVLNPLAEDEPFLRATLLDTLAKRAEYNLSRKQGDIRLFEIGDAFAASVDVLPREEMRVAVLVMGARRPAHFTDSKPPSYDLWDAKAIAERIGEVAFGDGTVGLRPGSGDLLWTVYRKGNSAADAVDAVDAERDVGEVKLLRLDSPVWAAQAFGVEIKLGTVSSDNSRGTAAVGETRCTKRFQRLPTTPAAEFDLALLVPDSMAVSKVEQAMHEIGGELLERVVLFDEFRGKEIPTGYRSVAWRLTFRHSDRTLKDKEIAGRRAKLLNALATDLGIKPRAS